MKENPVFWLLCKRLLRLYKEGYSISIYFHEEVEKLSVFVRSPEDFLDLMNCDGRDEIFLGIAYHGTQIREPRRLASFIEMLRLNLRLSELGETKEDQLRVLILEEVLSHLRRRLSLLTKGYWMDCDLDPDDGTVKVRFGVPEFGAEFLSTLIDLERDFELYWEYVVTHCDPALMLAIIRLEAALAARVSEAGDRGYEPLSNALYRVAEAGNNNRIESGDK